MNDPEQTEANNNLGFIKKRRSWTLPIIMLN